MVEIPWLEDEDNQLKAKLADLIVTDASSSEDGVSGRPVKVWFRFPEPEQREVTYPFITIDLINISEALDRAHRGGQIRPTMTGYRPPDYVGAPEGRIAVTDWPVAVNIDYQVTTWARSNVHDRQMIRQMWAKFPGRYGSLGGNVSPYVRPFSCQLLGMVPGDRNDEFGKRQFRKMFTLRVFSDLWASEIKDYVPIGTIDITLPPLWGPDDDWFSSINCYE